MGRLMGAGAAGGQTFPQPSSEPRVGFWGGERRRPANPIIGPRQDGERVFLDLGSRRILLPRVLGRCRQPRSRQSTLFAKREPVGRNAGTALGRRDPHLHPGLPPSSHLGCLPNSPAKLFCKNLLQSKRHPCQSPQGPGGQRGWKRRSLH